MLRPLPAGLAPSTSILAFAAGLFLLIASVRMMLVALFAPETPYYDEWDGVIELMARPLLAGRFDASTLLQLHNEHLLLWTRLLSYAQLRLADLQFDNVSVCLASQCLYAAMAAWLIAAATRHLGAYAPAFALAAGLVAVLPYGWENIAMGWGNPYYFLVGFSAGTVVLAARLRTAAGSVPLALCALAAGVSMGSGAAAGVVALLAIALRRHIGDLSPRPALATALAVLAAIAPIVAFALPAASATTVWGPRQSGELALLIVLWWPTWLAFLRLLRGRGDGVDVAFACLALWGLLQLVAILLGRPQFRLWYPISRYVEVLALGGFANLACLCRLSLHGTAPPWPRLAHAALAASIVAALLLAPFAWHWTRVRADAQHDQAQRLERYIRAGERSALAGAAGGELAYPQRERLLALVDASDVRFVLGDRVGTRPEPAPLVRAQRALVAAMTAHGAWLLPLICTFAGLLLWRAHRRTHDLPATGQ